MKTITNTLNILWAILVAINEANIFDLLPEGSDWVKFIVAALLVAVNVWNAQKETNKRKEVEHKLQQKENLIKTVLKNK